MAKRIRTPATDPGLKILKFSAQNVKGIRVIELSPEGANVTLSGANGAGKSSVLDAITTTLAGGNLPIHKDADSGRVEITIGPYTVTRSITAKGDRLVVKQSDGSSLPEPRTMLKKLVGDLCIDPVAFCSLKSRDQVELLFSLCPGLQDELDEINNRMEQTKGRRAAINLELGRVAKFPEEDPSLPETVVDSETLLLQKQEAAKELELAQKLKLQITGLRATIDGQQQIIVGHQAAIEVAQASIDATQAKLTQALTKNYYKVEASKAKLEEADRAFMEAATLNERVRERDVIRLQKRSHENLKEEYNGLLGSMKELDLLKAQVLAETAMPIEGLTIEEDQGVCFKGVPVNALSTSERVKVGAAIAVAQNPKAKIILADDASLLDSKSLEVLKETCEGFQLWLVVNDETGKTGIYLEDGTVG